VAAWNAFCHWVDEMHFAIAVGKKGLTEWILPSRLAK